MACAMGSLNARDSVVAARYQLVILVTKVSVFVSSLGDQKQ